MANPIPQAGRAAAEDPVAAGAIMPNIASSISTIFSQVSSVLSSASSQS